MKIIDSIKESATKYLLTLIFGFFVLLIGSIYQDVLPLIWPSIIQQLPKHVLLKLLTLATALFFLSWSLSLHLYLRIRKKLIPKFGVLWDKNKEAYCPACKIVLSEYHEQEDPPIYEFTCIGCNSDIRLTNFGEPISLKDAQKLLK